MRQVFIFLLCLVLHCECSGLRTASYVCAAVSDALGVGQVVHELIGEYRKHAAAKGNNEEVDPLCFPGLDEEFWEDKLKEVYVTCSPNCCDYHKNNWGLFFSVGSTVLQTLCSFYATATSPFLSEYDNYVTSLAYSAVGISLSMSYIVGCCPYFERRKAIRNMSDAGGDVSDNGRDNGN